MQLQSDPLVIREWQATRATIREGTLDDQAKLLSECALESRRTIVGAIDHAGLGHIGSDLSVIDILTCLYFAVLNVKPDQPTWPERDRLILSKGHTAVALYVTLARCGFFPISELDTFGRPLSALSGHPDRRKVPGVEASTGPLGHGLPIGVGAAIGARLLSSPRRVFVVLGDGELQEGSNWEAAMLGGHRELANLVAIVDRNKLQQGAGTEATNRLEPLAEKWRSFGWRVESVDGHDFGSLSASLAPHSGNKPTCVIANTTKGKGVAFMEDRPEWHHRVPSPDERDSALRALTR